MRHEFAHAYAQGVVGDFSDCEVLEIKSKNFPNMLREKDFREKREKRIEKKKLESIKLKGGEKYLGGEKGMEDDGKKQARKVKKKRHTWSHIGSKFPFA